MAAPRDPTTTATGVLGHIQESGVGVINNLKQEHSNGVVDRLRPVVDGGLLAIQRQVGASDFVNGASDFSWVFDGVDEDCESGISTEIRTLFGDATKPRTIVVIYKSTDTGSISYLFNARSDAGWANRLYINTVPRLFSVTGMPGSHDDFWTRGTAYDGNWHIVAGTYDGTNDSGVIDHELYFDGGTGTTSGGHNVPGGTSTTDDWTVAVGSVGWGLGYTDITLDEVGMWDVVLTPTEISNLGTPGSLVLFNTVQPANLQVWYRFGDGENDSPTGTMSNQGVLGSALDCAASSMEAGDQIEESGND